MAVEIPSELVETVMGMGFTEGQAKKALKESARKDSNDI